MNNLKIKESRHTALAAAVSLLVTWPGVMAQTSPPLPDAGRVLQQAPRATTPIEPSVQFSIPAPSAAPVGAGGPLVLLRSVRIEGATRYAAPELQGLLADAIGSSLDLAGLRALADRLTAYYRAQGYPFARAYVPAQSMAEGVLLIQLVEGRYGRIEATGERPEYAALSQGAQRFLHALTPGAVIEARPLERATLVLGDVPGVISSPTMAPGEAVGTGDLVVAVAPGRRVSGEVGLDNHGNRFTGALRLRAQAAANRLLTFGDELQFSLMRSNGQLWLGQASYTLPLNGDGLRAQLSASRTDYELGRDFAALGAQGQARVWGLGLSYPLLRSVPSNVLLSVGLQRKTLQDQASTPVTFSRKRSATLPVSVQFDLRDTVLAAELGAITYGTVVWTAGRLNLGPEQQAADAQGKRSAGRFDKFSLDLNRLQALPAGFTLLARAAGQWAHKNLDSSESFSLGGAHGVRAYPQGEAVGDRGVLVQLELRASIQDAQTWEPYAFYDAGRVRFSTDAFQPGANERSIAGAGLGLRYASGPLSLNGSAAWRSRGGAPQSDTRSSSSQWLVSASWRL